MSIDYNSPYLCGGCGCSQGICRAGWSDTGVACCPDCSSGKATHWMLNPRDLYCGDTHLHDRHRWYPPKHLGGSVAECRGKGRAR